MEERSKGYVKLYTKEQEQRIKDHRCPICNLHKDQWKRRQDWTCCSKNCTNEYSKLFTSWQYFKVKAFERDNWTCVNCGYKSIKKIKFDETQKRWHGTFERFKEEIEEYKAYYNFDYWDEETAICHTTSDLVGDHIEPIALGGEEYDLDNIQTLCLKCNKIKTKKDIQRIANFRKAERNRQGNLQLIQVLPCKTQNKEQNIKEENSKTA